LLQHFELEVSVTEYYGHTMIILLIVLGGNSYVTLVPLGRYVNLLNADDTLMEFDNITYYVCLIDLNIT